jgi:hypothetical protein
MLITYLICLALHRQLLMASSVIADSVPGHDTQFSCHSKLVIFYQRQLLLYGELLVVESIIADSVVGYNI